MLHFQPLSPNPKSRIPRQRRPKEGCFLPVLQARNQTGRLALAESPFPAGCIPDSER